MEAWECEIWDVEGGVVHMCNSNQHTVSCIVTCEVMAVENDITIMSRKLPCSHMIAQ